MNIVLATMQYGRGYGQGTERYVSILAGGMRARGHTVTILGGDPENRTPGLELGAAIPGESGALHFPTMGNLAVVGTPPAALQSLLDTLKPDVVHVANPAHIGVGLMQAAAERGVATVATTMDYWWICPKHTLLHYRGGICTGNRPWTECLMCIESESKRALVRAAAHLPVFGPTVLPPIYFQRAVARGLPPEEIENWKNRAEILAETLNSVGAVIFPSRAARTLISPVVKHARQVSIPYGLEPQWFRERPAVVRAKKPIEQLVIGFAGAIAAHKGVHLILEALRSLDWTRTKVRIAGGFLDRAYERRVRRLAEGLNVEFVGKVDSPRMPEFMGSVDVMLAPSTWPENLPIVVLESLAVGTPVLGSDVNGIAESIPDSQLRFAPDSATALAECLTRWVAQQNPPDKSRVATADEMVDATLAAYQAAALHRA